jgi:hypothetical protein
MKRTKAANAYVAAKRQERTGDATWFDVADAYDQGLIHGVEARESGKRAIAELESTAETEGKQS